MAKCVLGVAVGLLVEVAIEIEKSLQLCKIKVV